MCLSRFVPLSIKRCGVETRIVLAAGDEPPRTVGAALLKAVARARTWFDQLASGQVRSFVEVARREGITRRYAERLTRLAFVAPAIVERSARGSNRPISVPKPCSTASTCRWHGRRTRRPRYQVTTDPTRYLNRPIQAYRGNSAARPMRSGEVGRNPARRRPVAQANRLCSARRGNGLSGACSTHARSLRCASCPTTPRSTRRSFAFTRLKANYTDCVAEREGTTLS